MSLWSAEWTLRTTRLAAFQKLCVTTLRIVTNMESAWSVEGVSVKKTSLDQTALYRLKGSNQMRLSTLNWSKKEGTGWISELYPLIFWEKNFNWWLLLKLGWTYLSMRVTRYLLMSIFITCKSKTRTNLPLHLSVYRFYLKWERLSLWGGTLKRPLIWV